MIARLVVVPLVSVSWEPYHPRLLPTMQEAAAEDFGDAADTEQTFAMDNLFDPNMFGEAEHE